MTFNAFYLNLIKFLTMAFVLGFTAYVTNANEVISNHKPFSVSTSCFSENSEINGSK